MDLSEFLDPTLSVYIQIGQWLVGEMLQYLVRQNQLHVSHYLRIEEIPIWRTENKKRKYLTSTLLLSTHLSINLFININYIFIN